MLGHRGGRGPGWPAENSLPALDRALREGADGVEIDVRRCKTGEVVLQHDGRFADGRLVAAVPFRELPLLRGGDRVARLEDALDLCVGRTVNVEIKADLPDRLGLVRAVARAVARARSSVEIVVSSFDPIVVAASAVAMPGVRRGMLVGRRTPRLAVGLPMALRAAVWGAHLEEPLVTAARISRLSRVGIRVVAWTVNDPERARALTSMGVHALITDAPGALVALR